MTAKTTPTCNHEHTHRKTVLATVALTILATSCDDGLVEPLPSAFAPGQSAAAWVHAGDRDALVALYNATGGPDWTHNDNWLSDESLADWYGIDADSEGRVTGIRLRDNGLTGTLPAALGDLAELRFLHLHDNELTGSIPSELGGLGRLGALWLNDNTLSGALPEELAGLDSLRGLSVRNNGLEGVVPAGFKDIQPLFFDIAGNESLCLPTTTEFADWARGLLYFAGSWCSEADGKVMRILYDATDGSDWNSSDGWFEGLDLSGWHGVETDSVGRVSGLDLSGNGLSGELPNELGDLANLTKLNVSSNDLRGQLPQSLTNLSLDEFRYTDTRLCVPDDAGFRLWLRAIAQHEGTGTQCAPLSEREILEAFYEALGGPNWYDNDNWLTDAPLREWYGVGTDVSGNVIELHLSNNFLYGKIPPELGGMEHLQFLDLSDNYFIEGPIPPEFFDLPKLQSLSLAFTSVSGPLPPAIGRLSTLRYLNWSRSGLTGPLPPEIGNLTELRRLSLGSNFMVGAIPPELGNLSNLTSLNLSQNEFTGEIPRELGRLSALSYLGLGTNHLSGEIPVEFGDLTSLYSLDLRENELAGSIPEELAELTSLQNLYIQGNSLEGALPEWVGAFANLRELWVGNNAELTGAVPTSLSGLHSLEKFRAGGTGLCAPQDAEFLAWLKDVPDHRLARCDFAAAYLTQAVQSREFPVSLVAGQPALLRVFLASEHADGEKMPEVRATFHVNDVEVHATGIAGGDVSIPTEVDEGSLASSANADIPGDVIRPGLEVVIEVDPDGTLDPGLGIPGRLPETGRMAVEVTDLPNFDFTLVPFLYEADPDSSILELTAGMARDPQGHPMLAETRTFLPINTMDVRLHDPVVSSSNSGFDHLDEVTLMRRLEGGSGYWMGMRAPVGFGLLGVAYVPGWTSWSVPSSPTVAHELGHNLSLLHAPCAVSGDPLYPDPTGVIGSWGYDRNNNRLVSPYAPDIMSYCGSQWIGEYHRTKALGHRVRAEAAAQWGNRTRSLLVWGGLDSNGDPFLEPSFVADVLPALPSAGSDFVLRGRTEDGGEAFSLRFDMPEIMDADERRAGFVFAVPVTWDGDLETITLAGGDGSVLLDEDTNQPMTILRDPVTGQVRAILRRSAEQAMATAGEAGWEVMFSRGIPR